MASHCRQSTFLVLIQTEHLELAMSQSGLLDLIATATFMLFAQPPENHRLAPALVLLTAIEIVSPLDSGCLAMLLVLFSARHFSPLALDEHSALPFSLVVPRHILLSPNVRSITQLLSQLLLARPHAGTANHRSSSLLILLTRDELCCATGRRRHSTLGRRARPLELTAVLSEGQLLRLPRRPLLLIRAPGFPGGRRRDSARLWQSPLLQSAATFRNQDLPAACFVELRALACGALLSPRFKLLASLSFRSLCPDPVES